MIEQARERADGERDRPSPFTRELLCCGKDYAFVTLLSEEDYDWAVAQGNWFITHGKYMAEGKVSSGYAVRSVGKRLMWLHKEVLKRTGVPQPTPLHTIGDHENGKRLDNRRGPDECSKHAWVHYQAKGSF